MNSKWSAANCLADCPPIACTPCLIRAQSYAFSQIRSKYQSNKNRWNSAVLTIVLFLGEVCWLYLEPPASIICHPMIGGCRPEVCRSRPKVENAAQGDHLPPKMTNAATDQMYTNRLRHSRSFASRFRLIGLCLACVDGLCLACFGCAYPSTCAYLNLRRPAHPTYWRLACVSW